MALLKLGNWDINGNGFQAKLKISSLDAQGVLLNSLAFDNKIVGFWDDGARKITFLRVTNAADPSTFQVYTGYLMDDGKTLAGSFEAFTGSGATAERSVFGWFAKFP